MATLVLTEHVYFSTLQKRLEDLFPGECVNIEFRDSETEMVHYLVYDGTRDQCWQYKGWEHLSVI